MVLLINPKTTKSSELNTDYFREPNIGIMYLTAILDLYDIFVEILDLEQYYHLETYEIKEIIKKTAKNHNIFGITSLTNTFYNAISIAQTIKEIDSNNIIIFGGPHVSFLYNQILNEYNGKENLIDFICIGESEESFLELIKILQKHSIDNRKKIFKYEDKINLIDGLAFKNSKNKIHFSNISSKLIDLRLLPLPARFKLVNINHHYTVANIIVNRGCPNQCSFCSRQNLFKTPRLRTINSIKEEIRDIKSFSTYNVINFYDNINYNPTFFQEFCKMLKKSKFEIDWGCEIRVDNINDNLAKLLKESGCKIIATGIESANKDVLQKNFKYQNPKKAWEGLKLIKKNDIAIQAYFILGLPGETEKTFKETIDFIKTLPLDENDTLNYFMATPYPGSKLWNDYKSFGINILDYNFSNYDCEHIIFETTNLKKEKLEEMFREAKIMEKFFYS